MSGVSPARVAAYAVVLRTLEGGAYADRALRSAAASLDPRDARLAKQLAFGAVQRRGTLDWIAGRELDPRTRAATHLGIYQLVFLDGIAAHAAISESVELAKPGPGHKVVNAILRRVQREGVELPGDATPEDAAITHSHPVWLARKWFEELGPEDARALLAADNEPAEIVVRPNPLNPPPDPDLPAERLVAAGHAVVQSRAAQRVSEWVDPQPGERVLDLCAAPGGKATHLAALMEGTGTVVAVERHPGRAKALRERCARMKAGNVEVVVADAAAYVPDAPFDRVLVDPPCSGLGTLRSHPDLRWSMTPERIPGLVALQGAILAAGERALRPGGVLVYSTCTISRPEERLTACEHWQTLPHRDGTDGFYASRQWKPR